MVCYGCHMNDVLYTVMSTVVSDGRPMEWSSYYSRDEAETHMERRVDSFASRGRADLHTDWRIEEKDVSGLFRLPSKPTPRETYSYRVENMESKSACTWPEGDIVVTKDGVDIYSYSRNYQMFRNNFEPFRHKGRDYAMISTDYTASSVMDLETGEIIAGEEPDTWGFCPVGFYVPNWYDVYDGSIKPGTQYWKPAMEWNDDSTFGFVWGCIWGDDSDWKVQYLDLSRITEGILVREERFGYQPIDTRGDSAKDFITVTPGGRVVFSVPKWFEIETGKLLRDD